MTRNHAILHDFELVQCGTWWVHLRDNHPISVMGISTIIGEVTVDEKHRPHRIKNVLYIPELHKTLLLVWATMQHGMYTTFEHLTHVR
jgi:hypothetical protein